jgi:hypothetical protein
VAELVGIRHGPDALDPAVGDVEGPHREHATTSIEEPGARLAVDLGSLDPRRSPELREEAGEETRVDRALLPGALARCGSSTGVRGSIAGVREV